MRGDPNLKQIILDFKSRSSEGDVLYTYGFGDTVNTGPFYGETTVVFLTSSLAELSVQERIRDYLQAGLVQFVPDEEQMIQYVCSSQNRFVILKHQTYDRINPRLGAHHAQTIGENPSYVIIRLPCAPL